LGNFSFEVVAVGSGAVLSCAPEPGLGCAADGERDPRWPRGLRGCWHRSSSLATG